MSAPGKSLTRVNKLLLDIGLAFAYRKIGPEFPYKTPDFVEPADDASVQQKYPVLVSRCPVVEPLGCLHRVSFSWGWIAVYSVSRPKFGKLQPSGNSKPAGEYLPPSTHRHFLFCGILPAKLPALKNGCPDILRAVGLPYASPGWTSGCRGATFGRHARFSAGHPATNAPRRVTA